MSTWIPFTAGPEVRADGPVVVSLTDFTFRRRHLPAVARLGLRLRQGWYAMPGAVGLWLWAEPLRGRSGSVSVWTNEDDLRRFVRLPAHTAIMRDWRSRGSLRATTLHADRFDRAAILADARRWLADAQAV